MRNKQQQQWTHKYWQTKWNSAHKKKKERSIAKWWHQPGTMWRNRTKSTKTTKQKQQKNTSEKFNWQNKKKQKKTGITTMQNTSYKRNYVHL